MMHSAQATSTPATLLNRTLKMEDTIDPDTLLRRSSMPAGDARGRSFGQLTAGAHNQSATATGQSSASSSSVVTYTFLRTPRRYGKSESNHTVTDTVTATMVENTSSSQNSSYYNAGAGGGGSATAANSSDAELESAPRRKHCNCTKSQCLKLYCDCFANGEFCKDCNCKDCFNNIDYEAERQNAIKICLERNPHAFK